MSLSVHDNKKLLEVIDLVYSIPDRETAFLLASETLEKLLGISSAVYMPWCAEAKNFQLAGHVLFQAPVEPLHLFITHYAPYHPVVATNSHLTIAMRQGVKITDFVSARQYAENPYARECSSLTPHFYEMCVALGSQGDMVGGVGFHRKRHDRDFSERDRTLVNRLIPHFARAFHIIELRKALSASGPGGAIVMGARDQVEFMNDEAQRILNGRSVESIPDPGKGADPVFFRTTLGVYRVRTIPVRWSAKERIIFLERQPPERDLRKQLAEYALTARQEEIAVLVIRGLSNRDIAESLCICEQTVKEHLHDIFEKMKIRQRTELAAKVFGLRLDMS